MTLAATADLVAWAARERTAAGAAVLMQVSENTVKFHGGQLAPLVADCAHIAKSSSAPLAVHLDHFQDETLITEALKSATRRAIADAVADVCGAVAPRRVASAGQRDVR